MNLNLYGHAGKWLMVDLGMSFTDGQVPGVDLVFPDPKFIVERRDDLLGLILTHGHEDHIGAVPHLWPMLRCPIWATAFTAELVKNKLAERGLLEDAEIHIAKPEVEIVLGPFRVRYVPLAHSIAEGNGLTIETPAGTVFHTGDWKLDRDPIIGSPSTPEELTAIGDKGVLAMVGDSTNVFTAAESGSETAVKEALVEQVKAVKQRALITTFASNVARVDTIGEVAKATGRHLVAVGRSLGRVIAAAKATGYLQNLPKLVDEEDAGHLPRDKVLLMTTGCQGEPRAALSRIASGEHKHI
ncbi:MAG: ribonuclease J, partial [Sphingomonadales bacterium]|nr:ribonuclease J [Sphingomonadales bacterium]